MENFQKSNLIPQDSIYAVAITMPMGNSGSGKSFFSLNHPFRDQAIYLDLENRYLETLKFHPEIKMKYYAVNDKQREIVKKYIKEENIKNVELIDALQLNCIVNCVVYDENYDDDKIETLKMVIKIVTEAFTLNPKLLVMDSISDVRRMCQEEWEIESGTVAYGARAWGQINSKMKGIVYKAINFSKIKNTRLIISAHYDTIYTDDGKDTGKKKVPDWIRKYVIRRIDAVVQLNCDNDEYLLKFSKHPAGRKDVINWTIKINDGDDSGRG